MVATGGLPDVPDVPGAEHVADGWDVLSGARRVSGRVMIYDDHGGNQALDVAEAVVEGAEPPRSSPPNAPSGGCRSASRGRVPRRPRRAGRPVHRAATAAGHPADTARSRRDARRGRDRPLPGAGGRRGRRGDGYPARDRRLRRARRRLPQRRRDRSGGPHGAAPAVSRAEPGRPLSAVPDRRCRRRPQRPRRDAHAARLCRAI